jgi:hypothetical protein
MKWDTIIIAVLFGLAMWFVPNPVTDKVSDPIMVTHTKTVIQEIEVPVKPIKGVKNEVVQKTKGDSKVTEVTEEAASSIPYYEGYIDEYDADSNHVIIRSTTYPMDDSAFVMIEYNIQPRPCQEVRQTDSIFVMDTVAVPIQPPFYERPAFVIPVTAIVTYLTIEGIKAIFGRKQ